MTPVTRKNYIRQRNTTYEQPFSLLTQVIQLDNLKKKDQIPVEEINGLELMTQPVYFITYTHLDE